METLRVLMRWLLVIQMVGLVACAMPEAGQSGVAMGESQRRVEQPPMLRRTVQHDGIEREYFVHLPAGAGNRDDHLPAVVALHGYTSTATGFQAAHGLNRHADEHGYVVVYPQGSHFAVADGEDGTLLITSWNDLAANLPEATAGPHCTADSQTYPCPPECGECLRCAWTSCYDDVGFLRKVLDAVQAEFAVDDQRLYLLGVSNGAMMALRLGCQLSQRFAAIAPIIGQLAPGHACGPETDLPMLHLYGGSDETVRYDGRPGADDGFVYTSAAETASVWASAMACRAGPMPWDSAIAARAGFVCSAYMACDVDGHEVVSCKDPDGGHVWPEQGFAGMPATCVTPEQYGSLPAQTRCAAATGEYGHLGMDLIWDFVSRYRRRAATE